MYINFKLRVFLCDLRERKFRKIFFPQPLAPLREEIQENGTSKLKINNPFNAPVYYKDTVTSTMDEARLLAKEASGTVIAADKQSAGRGRMGRSWMMNKGENLSFTIMLRYGTISEIPLCLTLRAGLAVSGAIEDFTTFVSGVQDSPLKGRVFIKWPNDIMLPDKEGRGKKAAGILTEAENGTVYLGIGVNLAQQSFPPELERKACSIAQVLLDMGIYNTTIAALLAEKRFLLLEMILARLYEEQDSAGDQTWRQSREQLEERLYMKDRQICFIPGLPEEISGEATADVIEGILQGIGEKGEILITAASGETASFVTGELRI
ncbi:MAG: biotin--[acetyl-CoA-carboxylase] ligase [Treponema sp.]|jgi:BirA family biotin operon repressor/biotin-[acetyl-CoA-carboxylase] ligase|nr:biotin--[acetyl-CoA-carboxylase] ligase [Treponema sp.]